MSAAGGRVEDYCGGAHSRLKERAGGSGRRLYAEVFVCAPGRNSTARGPLQESLLNQIRLVEILQGTPLLTHGRGDCLDTGRASLVLLYEGSQDLTVELVETKFVDLEHLESLFGRVGGDRAISMDLGIIADPAKQAIGDSRRASTTPCEFRCAVGIDRIGSG